jgi:hypothetical protein
MTSIVQNLQSQISQCVSDIQNISLQNPGQQAVLSQIQSILNNASTSAKNVSTDLNNGYFDNALADLNILQTYFSEIQSAIQSLSITQSSGAPLNKVNVDFGLCMQQLDQLAQYVTNNAPTSALSPGTNVASTEVLEGQLAKCATDTINITLANQDPNQQSILNNIQNAIGSAQKSLSNVAVYLNDQNPDKYQAELTNAQTEFSQIQSYINSLANSSYLSTLKSDFSLATTQLTQLVQAINGPSPQPSPDPSPQPQTTSIWSYIIGYLFLGFFIFVFIYAIWSSIVYPPKQVIVQRAYVPPQPVYAVPQYPQYQPYPPNPYGYGYAQPAVYAQPVVVEQPQVIIEQPTPVYTEPQRNYAQSPRRDSRGSSYPRRDAIR